jgi:hypothetical protein
MAIIQILSVFTQKQQAQVTEFLQTLEQSAGIVLFNRKIPGGYLKKNQNTFVVKIRDVTLKEAVFRKALKSVGLTINATGYVSNERINMGFEITATSKNGERWVITQNYGWDQLEIYISDS